MSWNVVRSVAAALLLALVVLTAAPAHAAAPAGAPALEAGTLLQQVWEWVASIFGGGEEDEGGESTQGDGDHGCTIDPNGGGCI